jgi:hypothetical protein
MNDKAASINDIWKMVFDEIDRAEKWVDENLMEDAKALAHLHFNESDALYLIEEFRNQAKGCVVKTNIPTGTTVYFSHTTTGIKLKLADIVVAVSIENKDKPRKLCEDMTDDEYDEAKKGAVEYLRTWMRK